MVFFKIRTLMMGVKLEARDTGGQEWVWHEEGVTLARIVQSEGVAWSRSWPVKHLAFQCPPSQGAPIPTGTFKQTHKPVCPGTLSHVLLLLP